jgi:hypothetical protein
MHATLAQKNATAPNPPAGNHLAICRIHCATGAWAAAEQLVSTSRDPAAAYHLARLHEAAERVEEALTCYEVAERPAHGARLAKRWVCARLGWAGGGWIFRVRTPMAAGID